MKVFFFLFWASLAFGADEPLKEVEDYNRQAEQVLQQVDKMMNVSAPDPTLERLREKVLRLAQDESFLRAAQDLWKSPNRKKMLVTQLIFLVAMLLLKAWAQSRTENWFRRFLIGLIFSLCTWVGLGYVIPLLVLGEPFGILTGTLFRVLLSN